MPYLIDGHNLIARMPGMRLSDEDDEQQLIGVLQRFATRTRQAVEVFFDRAAHGHAGRRKEGSITVHFVSARSTADKAIVQRLNQLGARAASWFVVSSDQEVQSAARTRKAAVLGAEDFIRLLNKPGEEPQEKPDSGPLSDQELEDWLRLFKRDK